ncbi:HAD family hydrolase [Kitasatospora sp. DSM 101779]|uniref:HAD family hydrolase n=1 Tax=Kitasatospora sp. DSM 101779 TaxID=2853165 RepID=UPI0021D7D6A9|nr:HAD-IB family hydrolase [Kitasatospora sp. DSM 101779]MCU7821871.1 HAD-IB family hydrolase [Kitasatospora sp. DSM 101779]
MPSTAAAFFDVDETLVRVKSMFHFLEFYLRRRGEPEGTFARLTADLRAAAAAGTPRQAVNRAYYRLYAGESAERLAAAGEAWFERSVEDDLFVPETVAAAERHRAAGDALVLVSGSFFACLDPIAAQLRADWTVGTRPVVRGGRLTGEVVVPVIGEVKGRVASAVAGVRGLDLARCAAYGDHSSDIPLLATVGRPVAVGDDPVLTAHAELAGWQRLLPAEPVRAAV